VPSAVRHVFVDSVNHIRASAENDRCGRRASIVDALRMHVPVGSHLDEPEVVVDVTDRAISTGSVEEQPSIAELLREFLGDDLVARLTGDIQVAQDGDPSAGQATVTMSHRGR
jgi:hypothetical protein